jgi:hypothetical protein
MRDAGLRRQITLCMLDFGGGDGWRGGGSVRFGRAARMAQGFSWQG